MMPKTLYPSKEFAGVQGQVLNYYIFGMPVLAFGYRENKLIQNIDPINCPLKTEWRAL